MLGRKSLIDHEAVLNSIMDKRRAKGDKRDCLADNTLERYEKEGWQMPAEELSVHLREVAEAVSKIP